MGKKREGRERQREGNSLQYYTATNFQMYLRYRLQYTAILENTILLIALAI